MFNTFIDKLYSPLVYMVVLKGTIKSVSLNRNTTNTRKIYILRAYEITLPRDKFVSMLNDAVSSKT